VSCQERAQIIRRSAECGEGVPRGVVYAALGGAVAFAVVCVPAFAQVKQFDIPSEEAGKSLPVFARQAGVPIIAPGDKLHGVITPEIKGEFDVDFALERLLKGTGLVARRTAEGGIAISPETKEQKEEREGMSQGFRNSTSILALALSFFAGMPAQAQDDAQTMETVTVTGFRASLERALAMKREALDATDSITSEDIAKFPDKNVSESLQRIPGVALARGTGEGEQITVRGLGPT
jgi:iron complex outermembrane recepter protein